MKAKLIFVLLTLGFCCFNLNAQVKQLKKEKNGFQWYKTITDYTDYGAESLDGKTIIPSDRNYTSIIYIVPKTGLKGYFLVSRNKKEGVCNLDGEEIIAPDKYDNVSFISEKGHIGWYSVKNNGLTGACDITGKEIIPCNYNILFYGTDNRFNHMNKSGNMVALNIKLDSNGRLKSEVQQHSADAQSNGLLNIIKNKAKQKTENKVNEKKKKSNISNKQQASEQKTTSKQQLAQQSSKKVSKPQVSNKTEAIDLANTLWLCWHEHIVQKVLFKKYGEVVNEFHIFDKIENIADYTVTYKNVGTYKRNGNTISISFGKIEDIFDLKVIYTEEGKKAIREDKNLDLDLKKEIVKSIEDAFAEMPGSSSILKIISISDNNMTIDDDGDILSFKKQNYKEEIFTDALIFGLKGKVKKVESANDDVKDKFGFKPDGELDYWGDEMVKRINRDEKTKKINSFLTNGNLSNQYDLNYDSSGRLVRITVVGLLSNYDIDFIYQNGFISEKQYNHRKYINIKYDSNGNWIYREYKDYENFIRSEKRSIEYY